MQSQCKPRATQCKTMQSHAGWIKCPVSIPIRTRPVGIWQPRLTIQHSRAIYNILQQYPTIQHSFLILGVQR
jgi:hypothetical protein